MPLPGLDVRGAIVATGAQDGRTSLLLGADGLTGALASWTSTDGGPWERHWLDGSTFGGGVPRSVVAGGPGFVALGWHLDGDLGTGPVVWTSSDGVEWAPDPDPSGHFATDRIAIAATGSSVVISTCCDSTGVFGRPTLWTSTDGLRWSATSLPTADNAGAVYVAGAPTGYVAVSLVDDADGVEGHAPAAWRSSDGRTWIPDEALDEGIRSHMSGVSDVLAAGAGFVIAEDGGGFYSVATDGSVSRVDPPAPYVTPVGGAAGILWSGAPDIGTCLSAFAGDQDAPRSVAPDSSGCAISKGSERVVPMAEGWLVVSPGAGSSGDTVWAIDAAGHVPTGASSNGPASIPPASAIPELPTGPLSAHVPCPGGTVTVAKLIALSGNDRVACFGSRDLTFRAWVVDPGEGYGGTCEAVVPKWLLDCVLPDWLLATGKKGSVQLRALKHPGAAGDLKGVSRWVEVTGHFDDPAAQTCRLESGPVTVGYPPVGWYVLSCREKFAVTRIVTVH